MTHYTRVSVHNYERMSRLVAAQSNDWLWQQLVSDLSDLQPGNIGMLGRSERVLRTRRGYAIATELRVRGEQLRLAVD
jgi:hypothetical protein